MSTLPVFPQFKPVAIEDRPFFVPILREYQPETSEWTFTNLFIWREHYDFQWSMYQDWLIVISAQNGSAFALQPMGPPSRKDVASTLLTWLRDELGVSMPSIERADRRLVEELEGAARLVTEPARDHFDYVYLKDDLAGLPGSIYRAKRNRINKMSRSYVFTYAPLEEHHLSQCLELQSNWCEARRCKEDLSLLGEWQAIQEILGNFTALDVRGGVVIIDGRVGAFTVGEVLNDTTAVIHIEKADPGIAELYTVVNQQCAEKCWGNALYINREQDLGIPGLREAKLSYRPHHMVEKYRVTLAGAP
jgi:hypothetical protein